MSRRIGGEIWCEIFEQRPVRAGGAERQPKRVGIVINLIGGISRVICRRPARLVMLANADYRSPEIVAVFLFPGKNSGISHRGVDKGKQAGVFSFVVTLFRRHFTNDLIVETWR